MTASPGTDKKRGLFVSHVPASSIYGAATSLRLMLESLQDIDIVVAVPRPLNPFRLRSRLAHERETYAGLAQDVVPFFLPWEDCYEGADRRISGRLIKMIRNCLWKIFEHRFRAYVRKEQFDFVHLNSLALKRTMGDEARYVIHAREVLDEERPPSAKSFARAAGVIFIDERTKLSASRYCEGVPHAVINNPVDMTQVTELGLSASEALARLGIDVDGRKTVVSMIGTISAVKGVRFVIESFCEAAPANTILLIAGKGEEKSYIKQCMKMAQKNDAIHFLGEVRNMDMMYLATDVVVRGDRDFRVGRTVFEGLMAGCQVVIPGADSDVMDSPDLRPCRDQIRIYEPGSSSELAKVFAAIDHASPKTRGPCSSNLVEYADAFLQFIDGMA